MKLLFAGTSDFAVTILESLLSEGFDIKCVICQPDRPKGRKKLLTPCPVKLAAEARGLTLFQPEAISDSESVAYISSFDADAFAVAAYGQKIPLSLLELTPLGAINVHGSLLPALRGAAPIQRSIMSGLCKTGVTTMLMNEGMDTGDILLSRETPIEADDNSETLGKRLAVLGAELLVETLYARAAGTLTPVKQDDALATKAPSIKKADTIIDFSLSARKVCCLIRGLAPRPGAVCTLFDTEIKVTEAHIKEEDAPHTDCGSVLSFGKQGIEAACGRGSVMITRLQPAGGKEMEAAAFANRFKQFKRQ
ncbi:MAG: methionyl-tRNA formyltransferase [Abditibacteriota bacterium]|nr:methionyl-tRNA formyltransferase [Abditibacteriota bacterium]